MGDTNTVIATDDAYAELARVRATVVEALPQLQQKLMDMDMVSRATGSDSMHGNVCMEVQDMAKIMYTLMADLGINEKTPTCSLCYKPCDCRHGHNPAPLDFGDVGARCCDKCNNTRVLPARMYEILR